MSDETEWVLIGLDEKMARRQGIPGRLPVPKDQFEGLADKGLNIEITRTWIKEFLTTSEPGKSGTWRKQNANLVSSLEAFLDKAPLWDKAQKAFAENDYDKAISALKRITTMDPEDHAARLNLASAQANMGDHPAALKSFNAIRKTFEGDADFHVALGHVHLAMQQRDPAIDQMVLALEAKADCQPALDALAKLGVLAAIYENPRDAASLTYVRSDAVLDYLTGQWDAEPRTAGFFLEQLNYHEQDRRPAVALAAAERAIKAAGGDIGPERAELGRIAALRSLGRIDDAIEAGRAYAAKAPASSGVHVELAQCHFVAGHDDEGLAEADRALAIDPGDQSALVIRFWPSDQNDIEKVAAAITKLSAFAEAHPTAAGVFRSLARAKRIIGATDEALSLFAKAVDLAPGDDELRAEYWSELGKQQRYAEILADAAKVENIGRRDWKLRWNEAEAYAGLGKQVEARAAFSAINFDDSLHVDIRKRAKRAVKSIDEGAATTI
jgi:tetratricopeptide (TPR) repeat protein